MKTARNHKPRPTTSEGMRRLALIFWRMAHNDRDSSLTIDEQAVSVMAEVLEKLLAKYGEREFTKGMEAAMTRIWSDCANNQCAIRDVENSAGRPPN